MAIHKLTVKDVVYREFEIEAESEDAAVEILSGWTEDVGVLDEKCFGEGGYTAVLDRYGCELREVANF